MSDRPNSRTGTQTVQYIESDARCLLDGFYTINCAIPKQVRIKNYPKSPTTLGEKIRKHRIDQGLLVKDLAQILSVTDDTITGWENRGVLPGGGNLIKVNAFLGVLGNQN